MRFKLQKFVQHISCGIHYSLWFVPGIQCAVYVSQNCLKVV
jgi:hypothetical protein